MSSPLPSGSLVYLTSVNANFHIYAVTTDPNTPGLNTITINLNSNEATAIVPGLQGLQGPAGQPQFALDLQPDVFDTPAQLPIEKLTEEDFGKYWLVVQSDDNDNIVSSAAYVWWGNSFRVVPFGTTGPIGPVPQITPDVILIDPDETSYIENTGTVGNPVWTYYLAVPPGPQGPPSTLAACVDVDESVPPTTGQVLGFNGSYNQGLPVWQPMSVSSMVPMCYTLPESAFNAQSGISGTTHTVATFVIPPNPWPWKPLVWGQLPSLSGSGISMWGDTLINAEVRLGDPLTGTLVAKGFGNNSSGAVTIMPQASTSAASGQNSASTAMTPSNATALVPANHTDAKTGTLYVNLVNIGMAAQIHFDNIDAQLFIMCVPVSTQSAVATGIYGSLTCRTGIQAWTVTKGS